jgi:flagellar hook-associated protein 3 FlgL
VRITNSLIARNAVRSMLTSQQGLDRAMRQVTTGLRIEVPSDAPADASAVMGASTQVRALEQYERNINLARNASDAQEGVLNTLTDVLTRARELAVGQASDTASTSTRRAVKEEVDQLLRQAVQLANTRHNDAFLFGGMRGDVAPASVVEGPVLGFTIVDTDPVPGVDIADGQRLRVTDDAETIFGTTSGGALASLADLSAALAADDPAAIGASVNDLNVAFQTVQERLGATGARANQLEMTETNLGALKLTLTAFRAQLREVDVEQAMTDLVTRQTTYQAAMMAASRVIDLNLTNYLR